MKYTKYPYKQNDGFPRSVRIGTLTDGTVLYETVNSEEEIDEICRRMDEGREEVMRYFDQYRP